MVLGADVPGVTRQLDDLGQAALGVNTSNFHASCLKTLTVLVVELKAVTVALLDVEHTIGFGDLGVGLDAAGIGAQAHRAAQVGDRLLVLHQVDDVMGGGSVHLGAVGVGQTEDVAGKLDDHALHAQTDAEGGHTMLTAPPEGDKLALDAALAKSRGNDDAVMPGEELIDVGVVDVLAVEVVELEAAVMVGTGVQEALIDALVGILQGDILAHQADAHFLLGALELGEEVVPLGEVGLAVGGQTRLLEDDVVQALLVHLEGHLIDGGHVERLHHGVGADVAELRHLLHHGGGQLVLGAQHEDVGLDTFLLQQLDAVLGGLGLELLGSADVGDISQVDTDAAAAQLPTQLADGLDKRQGLDVAHGATYLGDDKVILARGAEQLDVTLDLVGDVGDDLDGLAQVIATPLLVDDALIDASGGDVVGTSGLDVGEALVVPQVQVGLMTIDGDIALAVLIGVQRPWIDVDVGVKLLAGHTVAAREQQAGNARGDNALTKRRYHAAGDKDVSCFHVFSHI